MAFFSQFKIVNNFFSYYLDQAEKDDFLTQISTNHQTYINDLFFKEEHEKKLSNIIYEHLQQKLDFVLLTREQIFLLLLMMYCGLIQNKLSNGMNGFYISDMRYIRNKEQEQVSSEKLKCIRNYFTQFLKHRKQIQNEIVCFTKAGVNQKIIKSNYNDFEPKFIQFNGGKIESHDRAVVVDFADRNIGGLVLDTRNLAQEEIIMLLYPEAIIAILFIPPMQDDEAVLIENLIKFNSYDGYEGSFRWKQEKDTPNKKNHMLAIDARPYKGRGLEQFTKENIDRELLKCFIGFSIAMKKQQDVTISTGKWGCGIFRGDKYLKSIIQITSFLKAASLYDSTKSKLIINTLNDFELINFGQNFIKDLRLEQCNLILALSPDIIDSQFLVFIEKIKQETKSYFPAEQKLINLNQQKLKQVAQRTFATKDQSQQTEKKQTINLNIVQKNSKNENQKVNLNLEKQLQLQSLAAYSYEIKQDVIVQNENCYAIAFNSQSNIMIAGYFNKIKVYKFQAGKLSEIQAIIQNSGNVTILQFMKKSNQFVSGSNDSKIRLWGLNGNQQYQLLQIFQNNGHRNSVWCIIISKEEDMIISSSEDKTIKFWMKKTDWECTQTLLEHNSGVLSISLSDSSKQLISYGCDNYIIIYEDQQEKQNWQAIQKIQVSNGCKVFFIDDQMFIFQTSQSDGLLVFECNSQNKFFSNTTKLENSGCVIFPSVFNKEKQVLIHSCGQIVYLIKRNDKVQFEIEQKIRFENNRDLRTLTEDLEYLVIFNHEKKKLEVWKQQQ